MNDLLRFTVDAHGGLPQWKRFATLSADVSIDGAIWHLKQVAGQLLQKRIELSTQTQRLRLEPFGSEGGRSVFESGRLRFESADGETLSEWRNPLAAFAGQTSNTPWLPQHVAYFASEALWTYLTCPFLFTYPGFTTRELEPWREDGEEWRRLEITFPDRVASHTRTQVLHIGTDGLIRRHDYTVDILGGATGANYPGNYRDVQGIRIPTTRRIYAYDAAHARVPDPVLVSVDLRNLRFA